MNSKKLQEKHLEILVRNGGFEFTNSFFPYTSGKIGPYYIQSAVVMKDGKDYDEAIGDMSEMVFKVMEDKGIRDYVVSGGERRDWIFSLPTATELGRPHAMICKNKDVLGANMRGKIVVHVADLNNEGSSPRSIWVPTIRMNEGGEVKDIFFYVDRMENGVQVMEALGLTSHSLVKLNGDAWRFLQRNDVVSGEIYKNLIIRMEDKEGWARKMLQSEKGFETLSYLASGDHKNKDKVRDILKIGYPDMEDELIKRLSERGIEISIERIVN